MTRPKSVPGEKPLFWTGSSKDDLLPFPEAVIDEIGTALSVAQFGGTHPRTKPWRGEEPGIFKVVETIAATPIERYTRSNSRRPSTYFMSSKRSPRAG